MIRDLPKYRLYGAAVFPFLQNWPGLRTGAGQSQCQRASEEIDLSAILGQGKIRLIWRNDAPSSTHDFTAEKHPSLSPHPHLLIRSALAGWVCGWTREMERELWSAPPCTGGSAWQGEPHAGLGGVCVCGVHLPNASRGLGPLSASWKVSIAMASFLKWISGAFYLFCEPCDW